MALAHTKVLSGAAAVITGGGGALVCYWAQILLWTHEYAIQH